MTRSETENVVARAFVARQLISIEKEKAGPSSCSISWHYDRESIDAMVDTILYSFGQQIPMEDMEELDPEEVLKQLSYRVDAYLKLQTSSLSEANDTRTLLEAVQDWEGDLI